LNGWLLLGQATQAQMNLYSSRVNTSPVQSYTLLEGSVEHIFPFNHKITLRGRESIIATSATTSDVAYSLEYSIPLAVPVRRITAVGQLRGIVKGENGRGVPNVLINAGSDAALTNEKGEFLFSSLKPGSYYVTVDRASIGLDNIMTQPTPIEVTIVGGEDTPLDLEVTRSVEVTGSVVLYSMKEAALGDTSTTYLEQGGEPGVFLELTNGTEINRRVTDSRGRFSFTGIRPGTWTLSVIGGNVPEYHLIIPDTIRLALSPGDKKDVTVQLKPRKRTIRILQEGSILPGTPVVPEKKAELPAVPEKKLESPPSTQQSELPCVVSYDARQKGYVLQISSWLTESKANAVSTQAGKISGMKSFTVTKLVPSLGIRYRVYLGVFKSQQAAEEMCLKLRSSDLYGDNTSVQKKHARNMGHLHNAKVSDTRQDERQKYANLDQPNRSWFSPLLFFGILVLLPR
jgi:hypothetical protein